MKPRLLVLVASLFFSTPNFALAQGDEGPDTSTPEQREEAATHFERGLELYQEEALDAALVEFERAYELVADYRVLYNLARVQTERHEYVEAIDLYERYLEQGGGKVDPDRKAAVQKELDLLSGRVARLTVESNVEGAEIFINGKLVGTLPHEEPFVVDSGVNHFRAEKSGYETFEKDFKIAGGESQSLTVSMVRMARAPVATATQQMTPGDQAEPRRSMTPFWISLSSTIALGGAAGTFGVLALTKNQQLKDEYDSLGADPERAEDLRSSGQTFSVLADVFTSAAVVSGALSVYFLARPKKKKDQTEKDSAVQLRVVPTFSGVSVRGSF